jgi:hypothetical protein
MISPPTYKSIPPAMSFVAQSASHSTPPDLVGCGRNFWLRTTALGCNTASRRQLRGKRGRPLRLSWAGGICRRTVSNSSPPTSATDPGAEPMPRRGQVLRLVRAARPDARRSRRRILSQARLPRICPARLSARSPASVPEKAPRTGDRMRRALDRLLAIVARLHDSERGCPWDRQENWRRSRPTRSRRPTRSPTNLLRNRASSSQPFAWEIYFFPYCS